MMRFRALRRIKGDSGGSTIVEFGLLAPVILALMFGLFHVGVQLQRHNALRSIASEASRYITVEYQKANRLNTVQMANATIAIAVGGAYMLSQDDVTVDVQLAETQRVTGAEEYTLTMTYDAPNWLTFIGVKDTNLSYTRPIFVPDP